MSTQLFCLSLINVNNNLVEKWRNVSQYYYADNANAVGNFRDLLDWAKEYITMIEATGYELGTKQSYSPYEIPEDIKNELRLLNIEILNYGMEAMGAYVGTDEFVKENLEKKSKLIIKEIHDLYNLSVIDNKGRQLCSLKLQIPN